MYLSTTEYQRASLTILPTENYDLPFMGHKISYLSSLLVTCHQSSRLYGVLSTGSTQEDMNEKRKATKKTNKNKVLNTKFIIYTTSFAILVTMESSIPIQPIFNLFFALIIVTSHQQSFNYVGTGLPRLNQY